MSGREVSISQEGGGGRGGRGNRSASSGEPKRAAWVFEELKKKLIGKPSSGKNGKFQELCTYIPVVFYEHINISTLQKSQILLFIMFRAS